MSIASVSGHAHVHHTASRPAAAAPPPSASAPPAQPAGKGLLNVKA
jgi:hypothetical protein